MIPPPTWARLRRAGSHSAKDFFRQMRAGDPHGGLGWLTVDGRRDTQVVG